MGRLNVSLGGRLRTGLVRSLMHKRTFQHKFVDQHFPLHELVVKAPGTILQGVEGGDRDSVWCSIIGHGDVSIYSTMRSLQGVGSILISRGRAKLLMATTAWPGARFGNLCQSESS